MSFPPAGRSEFQALTEEQRAAALEKAAAARRTRADLRERLRRGDTTVAEVLAKADEDEVLGKLKVTALLEALPGAESKTVPAGRCRHDSVLRQIDQVVESRLVRFSHCGLSRCPDGGRQVFVTYALQQMRGVGGGDACGVG